MAHPEILLLSRVLQSIGANTVFVDVGANIGNLSIALARVVGPHSLVQSSELQRIIFDVLTGSVALNCLLNVRCHNLALGDHESRVEISQYDYFSPMSFGSIEFGVEQKKPLVQPRGHDPAWIGHVALTTLDRFEFPRLDVLKIDDAGMEMDIFRGAQATIARCRQVLFFELLNVAKEALRTYLAGLDYIAADAGGANYLAVPTKRAANLPSIERFLAG